MSQQIDYRAIDLPDNEQYENWTYAQRRAYILSEIREVGHPNLLNQSDIARQFDVDRSLISREMDLLGEYVAETLGDRRELTTANVVNRCIAELIEEGEWKDAAELALKLDEWCVRETKLEEMQQQLEALLAGATPGGSADAEGVALEFEGGD